MAAKVASKDLYRELRQALAPQMKERGFAPLKGGRLGWSAARPKGNLSLWFQCDKWGWDADWGSKFTTEFQLTDDPAGAMTLGGRFERIGYLLEGFPELDVLRLRNNAIIERLPGTIRGLLVTDRLPDGTEYVARGERADPEEAVYGRDIWLNYYTIDDAREWAGYFGSNLLRFAAMFEDEVRSEQGRARIRFNEMMGRVQAATSVADKARIFEEYAATETDAHFAAGAKYWLDEIRRKQANLTPEN